MNKEMATLIWELQKIPNVTVLVEYQYFATHNPKSKIDSITDNFSPIEYGWSYRVIRAQDDVHGNNMLSTHGAIKELKEVLEKFKKIERCEICGDEPRLYTRYCDHCVYVHDTIESSAYVIKR